MNWDGMSVTLYTKNGIVLYLNAPNKKPAEFTLSLIPGKTDTYSVSFEPGCMHDCWLTCKELDACGTVDPSPIPAFPQWDESNQNVLNQYSQLLQPLMDELWTGQTNIKRLEGLMTVPYNGGSTDVIRIVRLPDAVPLGNGQTTDLIVVALSLSGAPLDENGGASGPPH